MKKVLAVVLAVAMLAAVAYAVNGFVPVSTPADDVQTNEPVAAVPADETEDADVPAPIADADAEVDMGDNTPTEPGDVLAGSTGDDEGDDEEQETTPENPGNGGSTDNTGSTGGSDNTGSTSGTDTSNKTDAEEADTSGDYRWHHDITPNDGFSIDAINGADNDKVWVYAENSGGNIIYDSEADDEVADDSGDAGDAEDAGDDETSTQTFRSGNFSITVEVG